MEAGGRGAAPGLTDTGPAALIEASAALQTHPVLRLHHLAVHGPVDNTGETQSRPSVSPAEAPASTPPQRGPGRAWGASQRSTLAEQRKNTLFAPRPAIHPQNTPRLPTEGAGHSRGPGTGVRALPGPAAGLRGEQAEGAGVRLLGSGGETARQGSGSGPGQGEPELAPRGGGAGAEPQWGIFSFAPPSRGWSPMLSSFDLEGSSLSWNIPENMPFQPSILYPCPPASFSLYGEIELELTSGPRGWR